MLVLVAVTTPLSVSMMADKSNPIRPVGSDVTLTCTVDLDPAVDVPVTVNTEWTGPDEVKLYSSAPVMKNLTKYISTVNISSFGRNQSGNYTCTANVTSPVSFPKNSGSQSATTAVTVGNELKLYYWGEPERAPHRRVECSQSIYGGIYIYYGTSVTRAPLYTLYAVRDIFQRPHEETSALSGIPRA